MARETIDPALLQKFSPLDGLKRGTLAALARKTLLEVLPAGRTLFREGTSDEQTLYLVQGAVELRSAGTRMAVVRAGTDEARHALAPSRPRRFTARAVSQIKYLSIDSDRLDVMLTWDQTGIYEVKEVSADFPAASDDWMITLLQSKVFQRIPASNMQAIFLRGQRTPWRASEVVIKQGAEGDYFYAIMTGSCAVTRESPASCRSVELAVLGPGDTFGEDALISGSKRDATVTMVTDGSLMRLTKDDFSTLLKEPILDWIGLDAANDLVARGGARWLDVRLPSEFETGHLPGAINIPLYILRLRLEQLDPRPRYVVCDSGRRSSVAAFILREHGFDASVLRVELPVAKIARRA
jgi:CRP-like cAMP-binding protein